MLPSNASQHNTVRLLCSICSIIAVWNVQCSCLIMTATITSNNVRDDVVVEKMCALGFGKSEKLSTVRGHRSVAGSGNQSIRQLRCDAAHCPLPTAQTPPGSYTNASGKPTGCDDRGPGLIDRGPYVAVSAFRRRQYDRHGC